MTLFRFGFSARTHRSVIHICKTSGVASDEHFDKQLVEAKSASLCLIIQESFETVGNIHYFSYRCKLNL